MSTHSAVCEPYGDSFRGRYVHFDGYPTYMGAVLWGLVKRDGYEPVRKTIIHDHTEWSYLGLEVPADPRPNVVEGYGMFYTDALDNWYGPGDEMEWTYVIADDGLWVYAFEHLVGKASWDMPEPNWQSIETVGYGT